MRGFYLYTTIDGVTVLRWYRTQPEAENAWRKWHADHGVEGTIRGEAVAS